MNNTQQQLDPSPPSSRHAHRRAFLLFSAVAIFTLAVAVIWALNDVGWVGGPWGKLAIIFFTWVAVLVATWTLLRGKE